MNSLPAYNPVIIVGAGSSGLMMAAQLLRFGIQPIILDSKTELSKEPKALAVQARSLEIFQQMGLERKVIEDGNITKGLILHLETEEIVRIDLSDIGEGKSPFPYVLILEETKIERILVDYLTFHACPIYWNTQLIDIHQTDKLATIKINRSGREEVISCDWLIGADGHSSTVRKSLQIGFSGGTYKHKFFLADVKVNESFTADAIRAFLTENGFTAVFPMQDSSYRFMGVLPKTLTDKVNLSFDDLKPYLTYDLGFPMVDQCSNLFSVFQVHHGIADRFKAQRCFLIGDAAHVQAGGQGINPGLQDAYNLAWKLAGVITQKYSKGILESYAKERMPVAQRLLKTTDRFLTVIMGQNWLIRKLRNLLLPLFRSKRMKNASLNQAIFGLVSQTALNYRQSPLSLHHSVAKKIKAGDRLPYIKFYDEKLKQETDLHSWCKSIGFTLIIIGQLSQRDVLAIAKWIKLSYPLGLNFFYLPPSTRNQPVFDSFEIRENSRKAIVVRPDMYIGYMNDVVDIELIGGYLKENLGWA